MQKFSTIPPDYQLKEDQIDIWQYPLHLESDTFSSILNEEENSRAERFHFSKHRRRFIKAHETLRCILSRYVDTPPQNLQFTKNKYGKPLLANNTLVHFNLSHSRDLALLAIGYKKPVGVDVEYFSARPYQGIGNNLFSQDEILTFNQIHTKLKPLAFFSIWAQKEAFIKACGMGLSYPTKQFSVPVAPRTSHPVVDAKHNQTWQLYSFMPQICCYGAICHHPNVQLIRYITLTAPIQT